MEANMGVKEFEDFFRRFSKNISVFPQGAKSKGENFDPFRKTSYVKVRQNSLPVKALLKTISPSTLIYRELGLVQAGSIQILIKDNDVSLIELSEKCVIRKQIYYAFSKALANKVQIFPSQFSGYSQVILFRSNE